MSNNTTAGLRMFDPIEVNIRGRWWPGKYVRTGERVLWFIDRTTGVLCSAEHGNVRRPA